MQDLILCIRWDALLKPQNTRFPKNFSYLIDLSLRILSVFISHSSVPILA